MKRMYMAITILMLSTLLLTNAQAGDRRVSGAILGGGTGAIVGQAIGHNVETTIIGATIGGVTGLLIGNELQRHQGPAYHPGQATSYSENHGDRKYHRRHQPVFKKGYRSYRDNCKKIITVKRGHHRSKRVVTTICDNNHRRHYQNRFNGRF